MKILSLILRILMYVVLVATVIFNALNSYILFAPDMFPKPFYVSYAPPPTPLPTEIRPTGQFQLTPTVYMTPSPTPYNPGAVPPGSGIMEDVGAKVVNLADPGGRRMIRMGIVLEFAPDDPAYFTAAADAKATMTTNFTAEITPKLPIVNDVLVSVISSKTYAQVATQDGKDALRQEIIDELNNRLPGFTIIYAYFTDVAAQ
jgi:flagellar FliL protein